MLEVDDIVPSPLTPLVLAPTVPKPVCEMQTPDLFTVAQSSPQPRSVDTANYARVNPLPSPATSSSSSGERHLYIDSDTSSPSVPARPQSSSQEHKSYFKETVRGHSHTHYFQLRTQQSPQYNHQFSLRTFHLGLMNWPQRNNLVTLHQRRLSPIGHTLVDPWSTTTITATGLPTASDANIAYTMPDGTLTAIRPGFTTSEAAKIFSSATPYDRLMTTDNYPCTDPSPRRRPRATAHEIYPVRSSPIQALQSPARHTESSSRGPQPSSSRGRPNPFTPTHGIPHRSQGPNFRFHEFTKPLGINTIQEIHVPERISYTSTPPQHTLKPRKMFLFSRTTRERICPRRTGQGPAPGMSALPHHFSLHGTILASVEVLFCTRRPPE